MSNNSLSPVGSAEPCFPWGSAEADEIFGQIIRKQAAAGILQLWHQEVSDFNESTRTTEEDLRRKGLTYATRTVDEAMYNSTIGLIAEAPLIAIHFAKATYKNKPAINTWGLIKVDKNTGVRIGDCVGFLIKYPEEQGEQDLNPNYSPEQVQVMTDQIALQKVAGISCRY